MLESLLTTQNIFYIILVLIIFEFVILTFLDYLNTLNWSNKLPEELKNIYDEEKYEKSMDYEKAKFKMGIVSSIFNLALLLILFLSGFFGKFYDYLFNFTDNTIFLTLLFFGILGIAQTIISLPFSYYSTFVIEEKFSFNKMDRKTFFLDNIKSLLLTIIIGGGLLALITWIYTLTGDYFWIFACVLMTLFSIFSMMFYSTLIVPLFNKQTPLEKGELRSEIENFAKKAGFKLDNIFVIDGSTRSNKANAYFSGFGPKKRIVLYDTLINDMTNEELVAVLAHEIGHYKKKHTLQMLVFSVIQLAIMFFILGLTLKIDNVSFALGATHSGFALGILAFAILFTPISMIFGILGNMLSRKNEYEADKFAGENYSAEKLQSALIKLSRNNLSNLRPHKAYEFFHYSHPTVLKRLKALDRVENGEISLESPKCHSRA